MAHLNMSLLKIKDGRVCDNEILLDIFKFFSNGVQLNL